MEKLAHNISEKIALQLDYDKEKKAVIAYGLIAIIQLIVIVIVIIFLGILFNMAYESIVVFFGVSMLKKSTGGAHSNSIIICTVVSIVFILVLAAVARYLLIFQANIYISLIIISVVFGVSFFIFYKKVPVDSPHKPIVKAEKIKRLRKQSFIVLILYIIGSCVLILFTSANVRFISISYCLILSIVWGTFMLMKLGFVFISIIDQIFRVKESST